MFTSSIKLAFVTVVLAALGACASSGPTYSEAAKTVTAPAGDVSRIYFYRPSAFGAAVQPEVRLNGEVVGRAVSHGYFYVDRAPGAYEVTTTTEVERKLSLTLDRGQTRYVRLNISLGFFVGHVYPELVDDDVAGREIKDLHYTGK